MADLTNTERPATLAVAGPRPAPFVIALPAGLKLLNSNQRLHHHDRRRITAKLRAAAMEAVADSPSLMEALAAAKPGPLFQRAHVLGVIHPGTHRRADPANLYPSFKAAVDGIVDAGLLEDDDHTRLLGPDMRLGPVVKGGQLVLVVRGLTPDEDPLGYGAVTR
ncbi:RusA-like resolvase [Streptomyces phage OnionKnight]|nr:RusA-like resolvase [Streptomyces phage OnionKnight]